MGAANVTKCEVSCPRREEEPLVNLQASLDWDLVARIKAHCKVPFGLKGIATAEDARLALDHGVDIIYISNHGGRQLDFGRGTAELLPEIFEVAGGKATIFMDGSVYRGTDVLKAMALGADAVGLGEALRLWCGGRRSTWVAPCAGTPGGGTYQRHGELRCDFSGSVDTRLHNPRQVSTSPSVFSAFQLIDIPGYD